MRSTASSRTRQAVDLGLICSFSIPIITICALLVLMIFISLLNIVFWWLPFLRICFPIATEGEVMDAGTHSRPRHLLPAARRRGRAHRVVERRRQHPRCDPDHPRHGAQRAAAAPGVRRRALAVPLRAEHRGDAPPARGPDPARALRLGAADRGRVGRRRARRERRRGGDRHDHVQARRHAGARPDHRRGGAGRMSAAAPTPLLDTRTYQDLVDEALARIPIHNPEWTNFNRSDPGVTLHRAVRVPHREPPLPHQPDPGAQPASRSSRCSACRCSRRRRRAGSSRSRTTAARGRRSRCTTTSRCAPGRFRSARRSGSTCSRSRRARTARSRPTRRRS